MKANKMHNFSDLFDKVLYMFRTDLLFIIRSLNTVYTAIGICHASYVDCLLAWSGWTDVKLNMYIQDRYALTLTVSPPIGHTELGTFNCINPSVVPVHLRFGQLWAAIYKPNISHLNYYSTLLLLLLNNETQCY
jgi:hypothetical protein